MTLFQVLFIIALIIPIAVVLVYFLANMMDDFKLVRDDERFNGASLESEQTVPASRSAGRKGKKKKSSKSTAKRTRKEKAGKFQSRPSSGRTAARANDPVRNVPQEREVRRRSYYTSPDVKGMADYPSDPYADYKRPDFDSYIRNANARDKAARESLDRYDEPRRKSTAKKGKKTAAGKKSRRRRKDKRS